MSFPTPIAASSDPLTDPSTTGDAFAAPAAENSASRFLRALGELAFAGVLVFFVLSPGDISNRHRAMMGLLGVSLPIIAWGVFRLGWKAMGWRLWLLFGAGFALSLAVKGGNLARPPVLPAAECALGMSVAAVACVVVSRQCYRPTGFEWGLGVAALFLAGTLLFLFPGVSVQNGLDIEVFHNGLGTLADYLLLLTGTAVLSSHRGSYSRMALFLSIACLVHLAWRHAPPAS